MGQHSLHFWASLEMSVHATGCQVGEQLGKQLPLANPRLQGWLEIQHVQTKRSIATGQRSNEMHELQHQNQQYVLFQ